MTEQRSLESQTIPDFDDTGGVELVGEPNTAVPAAVQQTSALVEPVAGLDQIEQAYRNYEALVKRLLSPDDYQSIPGGKSFVKKSGWRKLAVAMGVSVEILSVEHRRADEYDEENVGTLLSTEVHARATAPNGRVMDGIGVCSLDEAGKRYNKPEHDIPATASTRATNRACADLFGFGAVSAEEVSGPGGRSEDPWDDGVPEKVTRKPTARPTELSEKQLKMVRARLGQLRKDLGWAESTFPLGWKGAGLPWHGAELKRAQVDTVLELIDAARQTEAGEERE